MIDEASAVLQLQVLVLSASSLALHTRLPKLIETEGGIRLVRLSSAPGLITLLCACPDPLPQLYSAHRQSLAIMIRCR